MNPDYAAQDVLRCQRCETPEPPYHCDLCQIDLCNVCAGKHLYNESGEHKVLPIKEQWSPPNLFKCPNHPLKQYELHCKQCDSPICSQCASTEHKGHNFVDMIKNLEGKKKALQRDLQELEKSIYPTHQKAASNIPVQRADVRKHAETLTTALNKQREALLTEINSIFKGMQSEIDDMQHKSMDELKKREDEITQRISEISQSVQSLKQLLDSKNFYRISAYSSKNVKLRNLPPKLIFSFPTFSPQKVSKNRLHQLIGSLSVFSITLEKREQEYRIKDTEAGSCLRPLMEVPHILRTVNTRYNYLQNVSCLDDEKIWTRGRDNIIRLYNLQGELLKSIKTDSGNVPEDIAVTRQGAALVYADYGNRTVNMVKNSQTETTINLNGWFQAWKPRAVCSTSSGDLLVVVDSNNDSQTKVIRYTGSTEKHSIQYDPQNQPLYSHGGTKHVTENKNLDVCVADYKAGAVVVVDSTTKFRFRYTSPSSSESSFHPAGITTDSQGRILTADCNNHHIHIVDRDGHFLRYIDNCGLHSPWGLCVDSSDNLFVVEYDTDKVTNIQYTY
ncbi:uncharacterized protein LOC144626858 [Crassostrea virginica]